MDRGPKRALCCEMLVIDEERLPVAEEIITMFAVA